MSFQPSIRLALLSIIAICGCSTGTPSIPALSNPFAAASFGSKANQPPTQYSLSLKNQPKKRASALDWFRGSGQKAPSFAQAAPSPQAMLSPQSIASYQAPAPGYTQPPQGLAPTYQPPAPAMQAATLRSPFANAGHVAAAAPNVPAQYGANAQYRPPIHARTGQSMTAPYAAQAQGSVPTQYPVAASYGASMPPAQQYGSAQFPSATPPVSAQYSTASQYNAAQYTQPTSGSTLR